MSHYLKSPDTTTTSNKEHEGALNCDPEIPRLSNKHISGETEILLYEMLIRNSIHQSLAKDKLMAISELCEDKIQHHKNIDREIYTQILLLAEAAIRMISREHPGEKL